MAKPLDKKILIEAVEALKRHNGNRQKAAESLHIPVSTYKSRLQDAKLKQLITDEDIKNLEKINTPKFQDDPLDAVKRSIENKAKSVTEISIALGITSKEVEHYLRELKKEKFNVVQIDDKYELADRIEQGGSRIIDLKKFENKIYKIGITSDNHLNSKYERLDVLNALYDRFEEEGITSVYNAGNWVDGEARFNKYDLFNVGVTPQIEYFIKNYPQRNGITTYLVAGDDHEGWWVQREKINIGEYMQMKAELAGRTDLKYLGYVEYDVVFKASQGQAVMKVMHPGGGSAYAVSYSPQKMIESFSGGEKPQILILGHYHKADYMFYRNVHVLQAACTQNQTPFLRKKKIQVALGGWIVEFQMAKDGSVNRFKSEFLSFFNEDYYQKSNFYR